MQKNQPGNSAFYQVAIRKGDPLNKSIKLSLVESVLPYSSIWFDGGFYPQR